MAQENVYEHIEALNNLIDKLKDFAYELNWRLVREPSRLMDEFIESGYRADLAQNYRVRYMVRNEDDVRRAVQAIENYHIPYLERVIEYLKEAEGR